MNRNEFSLMDASFAKNAMKDLDISWKKAFETEFSKAYYTDLIRFLESEKLSGKTIYPPETEIFTAFKTCTWDHLKIVLIGQDPYHGEGQAQGLSFSVPDGKRIPPSLRNIFKELRQDVLIETHASGNLKSWAEQGVLLLNSSLTVRAKEPGSHQKKGWETFTDSIIKYISDNKKGIIFMLWGNFAKTKALLIDKDKHLILEAAHPAAELYGSGGFYGCKHFSKANTYLLETGRTVIDWNIR